MARKIAVEIVGDASSLERAFKKSATSADRFNQQIEKTGKGHKALAGVKSSVGGMAAGFVGVGAIAGGVKKSIGDASDLNEEISKSKVVFKDSSGAIQKWSTTTANALGISRADALKATGIFGNMLVPMGFARGKAADMSKSMVNLAGDMASFNNASPEDTLDALRSGLAGEAEPLRKFGVFLSDARLKHEAMRLGLYKGKGTLDANAKAQATYALIVKDTKDAQGDAARTGGQYAGTQRRLAATLKDLLGKIGTLLLPKITEVAGAVADWLGKTENQKKVMDTVKGVTDALSTAVGLLKGAFDLLSDAVGGNKRAIKLLIGVYAGWKVLTFAGKISDLAGKFGLLSKKQDVAKGSAGKLKGSLAGKAGVAGAVALASWELSKLIRKIPGWDKKMRAFGATLEGIMMQDPGKQFEGKAAPSQKLATHIRRRAAKLEAGGMTPSQAATRIARGHPRMALRDIQVLAGVYGKPPQVAISGGVHLHGVTNVRQLEEQLHKRAKQRPHRRRGT